MFALPERSHISSTTLALFYRCFNPIRMLEFVASAMSNLRLALVNDGMHCGVESFLSFRKELRSI